jgi:hypothetical protein
MNSRFHPRRLFPPSGGEPFFEPGPIMREPGPHQGFIPFPGIQGWLLRTPAEGFQAAGHVSVGELTSLEQPSSFQTSFFLLATGELSWAPHHGRSL